MKASEAFKRIRSEYPAQNLIHDQSSIIDQIPSIAVEGALLRVGITEQSNQEMTEEELFKLCDGLRAVYNNIIDRSGEENLPLLMAQREKTLNHVRVLLGLESEEDQD